MKKYSHDLTKDQAKNLFDDCLTISEQHRLANSLGFQIHEVIEKVSPDILVDKVTQFLRGI